MKNKEIIKVLKIIPSQRLIWLATYLDILDGRVGNYNREVQKDLIKLAIGIEKTLRQLKHENRSSKRRQKAP